MAQASNFPPCAFQPRTSAGGVRAQTRIQSRRTQSAHTPLAASRTSSLRSAARKNMKYTKRMLVRYDRQSMSAQVGVLTCALTFHYQFLPSRILELPPAVSGAVPSQLDYFNWRKEGSRRQLIRGKSRGLCWRSKLVEHLRLSLCGPEGGEWSLAN